MPDSTPRTFWVAMVAITVIGAGFRIAPLHRPMDYDESFTALHYVSKPLNVGLSDFSFPNNHLGHTFLAHVTTSILGNHPWSLRLPACVAGILLIPAAMLLAKAWFGAIAGVLTGTLVAGSSFLVDYSTNARGYGIQALLIVLAILALRPALQSGQVRFWAGFIACSTLAFYVLPTTLFFYAGMLMWAGLMLSLDPSVERPRASWIGLVVSTVVIVAFTSLLYVPVLLNTGWSSLAQSDRFAIRGPIPVIVPALGEMLREVWQTWQAGWHPALWALILAGFGMGLFVRPTRIHLGWLFACILLVSIGLVLVRRVVPFARTWLPLLPLSFILAGGGWSWMVQRLTTTTARFPQLLTLSICVIVILGLQAIQWIPTPKPSTDASDELGKFVKDELQPGDYFVIPGLLATPIAYYLDRDGVTSVPKGGAWEMEFWRRMPPPGVDVPKYSEVYLIAYQGRTTEIDAFLAKERGKGITIEPMEVRRIGNTVVSKFNNSVLSTKQKKEPD